ncbi:hypothetical protein AN963_09830 [Brevibacillus choshinensis]|uniref:Secreted protein n=1 Tax=Brevibacillus choshinensis TaxID=54911 RepID=A0ABR5NEJ8_BRECH|nr:hypothetical protein AN963_09830 [Brevibacillus choshinensis]
MANHHGFFVVVLVFFHNCFESLEKVPATTVPLCMTAWRLLPLAMTSVEQLASNLCSGKDGKQRDEGILQRDASRCMVHGRYFFDHDKIGCL